MKEDGCRPVRTRRDDGARPAGRRGSATAVLGSSPQTPSTKTNFNGGVGWGHSMVAAAFDGSGDGHSEAVLRRQGQRVADADSRCNNQIKTMAAAAGGGNGGHTCVVAVIDDGGNRR
jgi:hypothetical protein